MRITRTFLVLLLLTGLGAGCAEREETRAFTLETLDARSAVPLITPFVGGDSARVGGTIGNRVVTVRGTSGQLDAIAAFLAEHDQPGATVTLRFQVVEANGFDSTDPAIADVESALRDVLAFEGYRLVSEGVVRVGRSASFGQQLGAAFAIGGRVRGITIREDAAAVELEIHLLSNDRPILNTEATVPVGQIVVLGNTRDGDGPTYILVVRPTLE
ncbi:MAG: hypothetical protein WEB88_01500 [Gemmatimonadota bacterium]